MRLRWIAVLVVAALGATAFVLLPPSRRVLPSSAAIFPAVRGAFHVHTTRSDGTGTVDQVAAAAARAGLSFVIFTDHGDASRAAEPPTYRDGVLCIDAVEISTTGGHVVALGAARSPYPLGGEPRDVVEDIARLGGMSIAAHPTSAKASLKWTDWSAPIDGLEWLNGDSEWRDETWPALGEALLTYPFRRASTLAALLDRPDEALRRWDAISSRLPLVGLAASDAHARLGLREEGDPASQRFSLHLPSYEQVFRTFSISVTGVALTRTPTADAAMLIDAIRRGRVYASVDELASPAYVSFRAVSGEVGADMGNVMPATQPASFVIDTNAPADARIALLKGGRVVAMGSGPRLEYTGSDPGAYRAEITLSESPGAATVPWVVTNPIYLGVTAQPSSRKVISGEFTSRYQDGAAGDWRVEKSTQSEGAINVVRTLTGTQVSFRFALGGSAADGPFAGIVLPAGAIAGADRLMFTATASRPLRMSVQLRSPGGTTGERWRRSVYVDENARAITIPFAEMTPVGATGSDHPVIDRVSDVLFVVDMTNARPGTNGQIWIDDVKYGRP